MYKNIKLLIIDDSIFFKELLKIRLSVENGITFINEDSNIIYSFQDVKKINPDFLVVNLDIEHIIGKDFLEKVLKIKFLKLIVVSSYNSKCLDAMNKGSYAFIYKSNIKNSERFNEFYNRLLSILRNEVTHVFKNRNLIVRNDTINNNHICENSNKNTIIVMGASTGGTDAVLTVIKDLPEDTNPILIVQHMPAQFIDMYVKRADKECLMKVEKATHLSRVEIGKVLIAPGDLQMRLCKDIKGFYVECVDIGKINGYSPSVDFLFNSCAKINNVNIMGILLTGMGNDGAKGLLNMKNAGHYTVVQDEKTCVVYGMPMIAHQIGGDCKQLGLDYISQEIVKFLKNKNV